MAQGEPASGALDGADGTGDSGDRGAVGRGRVPDQEYAELHAHTNFSLLDGTSDPEMMVQEAASLGLRALAITDHDSIAGIVRFAAEAKRRAVPAIIGVELTIQAPRAAGNPARPGGGQQGTGRRQTAGQDDRAADRQVVLLAQDLTGYQNICRLLTRSYERGGKDHPHVPFDLLAQHSAGLIALSGGPRGELASSLSAAGPQAAGEVAARYRDVFPDRYFVELGRHGLQLDGPRNAGFTAVARQLGLRCVATNDAYYHNPSRALLSHVVTCIRHGTTLQDAGALLRGNDEYYLKSAAQMARLFRQETRQALQEGRPELDPIRTSVEIAGRCIFGLRDIQYQFPHPRISGGETEYSFLCRVVEAGKRLFYPNATPEVEARLQHELAIVLELDLAGYLLVFREIVDWSHEQGILCSIRGSAPASALLYCLGLCPIDPLEHGLLFERFCSPERKEYPDIDLDFAHERREEVIQHVYEKYGREYAAMVCEVNTYRVKSAIRDVAKVLGLSAQRAQQLANQIDWYDPDPRDRLLHEARGSSGPGATPSTSSMSPASPSPTSPTSPSPTSPFVAGGRGDGGMLAVGSSGGPRSQARAAAVAPADRAAPPGQPDGETAIGVSLSAPLRAGGAGREAAGEDGENGARIGGRLGELLVTLAEQLKHSPRHHSIHVGGMVISSRPLNEVTSIEPARMPNRTILPWDKDDLTLLAEEFGIQLIKMDLLGLGMLAAVGRCFTYVRQLTGRQLELHGFRYDPRAFDVLCEADTVGLFQVESRAQQSFLPRLKPRTLAEVAISVGAIRPGPGAARAGEHIVRRRQGREPITYPTPELKPALQETYGVLLWQEQCIQVAVIAAGYTPGEADQLRRAMSHKRSYERMNELTADLMQRMLSRGYTARVAEAVRLMIAGFAGYGFPRAHAYPFAHVALISATLRLRYPAAYYAALLNCQPMGFYAPHTLVWDAHRHGVTVLPVDINRSAWESTLEYAAQTAGVLSDTTGEAEGRDAASVRPQRQPAIRLGLKEVHGLGSAAQAVLEREQARGPFRSLADVVARTGFDGEKLERLAEVGAFVGLEGGAGTGPGAGPGVGSGLTAESRSGIGGSPPDRRADVWATGGLAGYGEGHLPGLAEQLVEPAALTPMGEWEEVQADYRGVGFSVGRHVVRYFRPRLERLGALRAADVAKARRGLVIRAGGMVIVRQRPETASHVVFLTLEDETGLFNGIVLPHVYERFRQVLRGEPLLVIEGPTQVQDDAVRHILVRRAWPLVQDQSSTKVPRVPSHDFH